MTELFDEPDKKQLDMQLDRELEDTFPASDPLTITRFPRKRRGTDKPPVHSDTGGAPSDDPRKVRSG
ncbi:MAG TPA: hypothetical protein VEU94_09370 [Terriglobales bacterium]|jgi:hypothetical protein|nr:hypothetical protein [Terriglobales bacterium]